MIDRTDHLASKEKGHARPKTIGHLADTILIVIIIKIVIIIIITCPTEVAVTLSSGGNQVAETASGPELITMLEMPLRMLQCGDQELVSCL